MIDCVTGALRRRNGNSDELQLIRQSCRRRNCSFFVPSVSGATDGVRYVAKTSLRRHSAHPLSSRSHRGQHFFNSRIDAPCERPRLKREHYGFPACISVFKLLTVRRRPAAHYTFNGREKSHGNRCIEYVHTDCVRTGSGRGHVHVTSEHCLDFTMRDMKPATL